MKKIKLPFNRMTLKKRSKKNSSNGQEPSRRQSTAASAPDVQSTPQKTNAKADYVFFDLKKLIPQLMDFTGAPEQELWAMKDRFIALGRDPGKRIPADRENCFKLGSGLQTKNGGEQLFFFCQINDGLGSSKYYCDTLICERSGLHRDPSSAENAASLGQNGRPADRPAASAEVRPIQKDIVYYRKDRLNLFLSELTGLPEEDCGNLFSDFDTKTVRIDSARSDVSRVKGLICDSGFILDWGIKDRSGSPILFYCVNNQPNWSQRYYCDTLICGDKAYFYVFNKSENGISADWVHVHDDLNEFPGIRASVGVRPDLGDFGNVDDFLFKLSFFYAEHADKAVYTDAKGNVCDKTGAKYLFIPTPYQNEEEQPLYLRCSRNTADEWKYDRVVWYKNAPMERLRKRDWLNSWARMKENEVLNTLKEYALPERWESGADPFGILRSYLRYTFAHQVRSEKGILYSEDKALLNTGLPAKGEGYLYLRFEKLENETANAEWIVPPRYKSPEVITQDHRYLLGSGVKNLKEFPEPPKYFKNRAETIWNFNIEKDPEVDWRHILITNCNRLPISYYRQFLLAQDADPEFKEAIEKADEKGDYGKLRSYLSAGANRDVFVNIKNDLRNKINTAIENTQWNWRAIVYCVNPEEETACYLIPMTLTGKKPEVALVAAVRDENDNKASIETVFTLEMAYQDARLVCRPESNWLLENGDGAR